MDLGKLVIELPSLGRLRPILSYKVVSESLDCSNKWEDIWKWLFFYYKVERWKKMIAFKLIMTI